MKSRIVSNGEASPYTLQNIEIAIAHLEHILDSSYAQSLFPGAYWHQRILQAVATPGLTQMQQERLHRLFDRVTDWPLADKACRTRYDARSRAQMELVTARRLQARWKLS